MATKTPLLNNPIMMGRHLASATGDEYLSEAQYILDDTASTETEKVSIQDTIDDLKKGTSNWATSEEIDDMFEDCPKDTDEETPVLKPTDEALE